MTTPLPPEAVVTHAYYCVEEIPPERPTAESEILCILKSLNYELLPRLLSLAFRENESMNESSLLIKSLPGSSPERIFIVASSSWAPANSRTA